MLGALFLLHGSLTEVLAVASCVATQMGKGRSKGEGLGFESLSRFDPLLVLLPSIVRSKKM